MHKYNIIKFHIKSEYPSKFSKTNFLFQIELEAEEVPREPPAAAAEAPNEGTGQLEGGEADAHGGGAAAEATLGGAEGAEGLQSVEQALGQAQAKQAQEVHIDSYVDKYRLQTKKNKK